MYVPMKIYRFNIAYQSRHQKLFYFGPVRWISVVESDNNIFTCTLLGIQYSLRFYFINGQWFLCDDVAPHFHTFDDYFMVKSVFGGDDENFRFCLFNHLLKICKGWATRTNVTRCKLQSPWIGITQSYHVNILAIIFH